MQPRLRGPLFCSDHGRIRCWAFTVLGCENCASTCCSIWGDLNDSYSQPSSVLNEKLWRHACPESYPGPGHTRYNRCTRPSYATDVTHDDTSRCSVRHLRHDIMLSRPERRAMAERNKTGVARWLESFKLQLALIPSQYMYLLSSITYHSFRSLPIWISVHPPNLSAFLI